MDPNRVVFFEGCCKFFCEIFLLGEWDEYGCCPVNYGE